MIAIKNETSAPAFILASLLSAYPDEGFAENVGLILEDEQFSNEALQNSLGDQLIEIRAKAGDVLGSPAALDDLRSEYIDLFDRGKQVTSLYETEYGRERAMVKGNELVDIAGFYRAFGLETGGEGVQAEMIDHVSVELEFYALMVMKSEALADSSETEGAEIVLDARKKFLKSHLGRFVGAICERPGVIESPFYSAVFKFCRELVADECRRLEVEVESEQWISSQAEVGDISCGGSVGCVK